MTRQHSNAKRFAALPRVGAALTRELDEARLQLEAIFEAITDAVAVFDRKGQVTQMNAAAQRLFRSEVDPGYFSHPPSDHPPFVIYDLHGQAIPPERWPVRQILGGATLTGTQLMEMVVQSPDGREVHLSASGAPLRDQQGQIIGAVTLFRDMTEYRRAEREARAEAEAQLALWQLILDELPSSVYLVRGKEARLVLTNRATATVWGAEWLPDQPMEDFLAANRIRLFGANGQLLAPGDLVTLRAVQQGETMRQQQEIIRRPDGTTLPVLVNAVALGTRVLTDMPVQEGRPAAAAEPLALVILQDVTALKEAEHLKDEFIGLAAHELRNPLAALKGFVSMLLTQTAHDKSQALASWQQEALGEIDLATVRLDRLTEDLLDVTRLQAGRLLLQKRTTNLVTLCEQAIAQLQTTTDHHHFSFYTTHAALEAYIDPKRMVQVLSNLLGNAVKYSPRGGPIDVAMRCESETNAVLLSVRDMGIGIPREQQAQIFGRFARATNAQEAGIGGTGLGLYLCRELVEQHGGRIWFESVEGEGSTFFLLLPLTSEAERPIDPSLWVSV